MNIQNVILGFLLDEPMTGYEIKARFDKSISHFFEASFGGIYPALRRMEQEGLIVKEVLHQEGKPSKNLFAITGQGHEAFKDYLQSPVEPTVQRSDLLLRVFFGRHCSKEQMIAWLEQERQRLHEGLDGLLMMQRSQLGKSQADPFRMKTLEYGIAQLRFGLEWVEKEIAVQLVRT